MARKLELSLPSLGERDRRWELVRAKMAERSLECLVLPPNSGQWENFQGDVRYLTAIGGGGTSVAAVFPLVGETTAILLQEREAAWFSRAQNWVADVRGQRYGSWGLSLADRVKELRLGSGRIGIVGLRGVRNSPEGIGGYGTMLALQQALPSAIIEDATALVQDVRIIKSDEEVEFLECASAVLDGVAPVLAQMCRPGIPENVAYGEVLAALARGGSEFPIMVRWGANPEANATVPLPSLGKLEHGDIVVNEINAKVAGYTSQIVHPVHVGSPAGDMYLEMMDLARKVFETSLATIKPGVAYSQIIEAGTEALGDSGYTVMGMVANGKGLGSDQPLVNPASPDSEQQKLVQEGMVFITKLGVRHPTLRTAFSVGDTVVVTANGCRRLGKRKMDPIVAA